MTQSETALTMAEVEEYVLENEEHEAEHTAWLATTNLDPQHTPHFCDAYGCQSVARLARALIASQTALREVVKYPGWLPPHLRGWARAALLPQGGAGE